MHPVVLFMKGPFTPNTNTIGANRNTPIEATIVNNLRYVISFFDTNTELGYLFDLFTPICSHHVS